jgi:hypothetical protein
VTAPSVHEPVGLLVQLHGVFVIDTYYSIVL